MAATLFTVFTPTYNRAHTLPRVYASLAAQTFKDFEWLVVDDGSVDDTRALVEAFQRESRFAIRYVYQPNAGKHAATNHGVALAKGELFLTFDSDDECEPEALQVFRDTWFGIPDNERPDFTGVTCLCKDAAGNIIGDRFPTDPFDSDSVEFKFNLGIKGEKWGFHRTDVLRQFPFPLTGSSVCMPEDIVWVAIGAKYKTRFINRPLRLYHADSGNQLTKEKALAQAANQRFFYDTMVRDYSHRMKKLVAKSKIYTNLSRYRSLDGQSMMPAYLSRLSLPNRLLWLFTFPIGLAFATRDRMR